MEVSHEYQMTPIDFEVTGLKVMVTGALTKKKLVHPIVKESFDPQSSYFLRRLVMSIR